MKLIKTIAKVTCEIPKTFFSGGVTEGLLTGRGLGLSSGMLDTFCHLIINATVYE